MGPYADMPLSFVSEEGISVNVFGIWPRELVSCPCPRDRTDNNVLVMTNRGNWLYCFDCGVFYPEGGKWGYMTSSANLERMINEIWTRPLDQDRKSSS